MWCGAAAPRERELRYFVVRGPATIINPISPTLLAVGFVPVVFKDAFQCLSCPPPPPGDPEGEPDCLFPSETGVLVRIRGGFVICYLYADLKCSWVVTLDARPREGLRSAYRSPPGARIHVSILPQPVATARDESGIPKWFVGQVTTLLKLN